MAAAVQALSPEYARQNEFYAEYLGTGAANPLKDWLVFEVIGFFAGGFIYTVRSLSPSPSLVDGLFREFYFHREDAK
jgi:hypothetical protein